VDTAARSARNQLASARGAPSAALCDRSLQPKGYLARAYRKLAISSREELPDAFRQE
jgi:hypothetical protein